jgi:acetyltransferase-like isoleucine patch superfamily enzyme
MLSEFRLYLCNYIIAFVPFHSIRLYFFRHVMGYKIGIQSSIFMGSRFDCAGSLVIGDYSTINANCYLDSRGGLTIGDSVAIADETFIITAQHDINSGDFSAIFLPVVINDYAFVGRRSLILPGCNIGKCAVLGAGSVLTKNIPDNEVWAGNPAIKIGERTMRQPNYKCSYMRLFH